MIHKDQNLVFVFESDTYANINMSLHNGMKSTKTERWMFNYVTCVVNKIDIHWQ